MDQIQAEPRRRRRLQILAFVLAVAATFSWWHWPRRDAGFVGKWVVTRDAQVQPFGSYEFRADGSFIHVDDRTGATQRVPLWFVSDRKVFVGLGVGGEVGRVFRGLSSQFNRIFGNEIIRSALPLAIASVGQDVIVLQSEDRAVKLTLRRSPI